MRAFNKSLLTKIVTVASLCALHVAHAAPKASSLGESLSSTIRRNGHHLPGGKTDVTPTFARYVEHLGKFDETITNVALISHLNGRDRSLMFYFIEDDENGFFVTPVIHPYQKQSDQPTHTPKSEIQNILDKVASHLDKQNLIIIKADGTVEGQTNSNNEGRLTIDLLGKLKIANLNLLNSTPIALRYRAQGHDEALKAMVEIATEYFEHGCDIQLKD